MNHSPSPPTSHTLTAAQAMEKARAFLLETRGGRDWLPYAPGGECSLEATAWSLLALRHDQKTALSGINYLISVQNKDGGWSTEPGAGRSDWTTGVVFLSLRQLTSIYPDSLTAEVKKSLTRAFNFLVDNRVEFYGPTARLLLLISKGPDSLAYGRGWPWDPKCFHWVEPTSYCLLALKLPTKPDKEIQLQAIHFAEKFILEHACKGGGWNHGNDLSLGAYLPPYRWTTAEALLAIQDLDRQNAKIQAGLKYLQSFAGEDSSSLSLALSILALKVYDCQCDSELHFLRNRQAENGSFGPNIFTTAVSLLALQAAEGDQILKVAGAQKGSKN